MGAVTVHRKKGNRTKKTFHSGETSFGKAKSSPKNRRWRSRTRSQNHGISERKYQTRLKRGGHHTTPVLSHCVARCESGYPTLGGPQQGERCNSVSGIQKECIIKSICLIHYKHYIYIVYICKYVNYMCVHMCMYLNVYLTVHTYI